MGAHGSGRPTQERSGLTEAKFRRSDLYGRRLGRPLSESQNSLVQSLLPRISLPDGPIDVGRLFPNANRVALEVGFGSGEHLLRQAELHPEAGFIGCEPFLNGVAKLLSSLQSHSISNVRVVADDARGVIARLPNACLSQVFVLFPDPWPKLRHHKRRFIQVRMLNELSRAMKSGAELRLATDHQDYAAWALMHLQRHPDFFWQAESAADWRVRPENWVPTRYEQKALKAGKSCVYLRFVRR